MPEFFSARFLDETPDKLSKSQRKKLLKKRLRYEADLEQKYEEANQIAKKKKLEEEEAAKKIEEEKPVDIQEEIKEVEESQFKEMTQVVEEDIQDDAHRVYNETSDFYGETLHDYQGRTYIHCPKEFARPQSEDGVCFPPKKVIHTAKGHTKGVNSLELFPKTGHLLLSSSHDGTVRIWDVHNDKRCLREFKGHHNGVREAVFSKTGETMLSVSYDKYVKLWDVEYGVCLKRFSTGVTSFCAKFCPFNQNQFLTGQSNNIILQWDIRQRKICQVYKEHLRAVNYIQFLHGRYFVSSADDKKLLVWQYGIPVVTKHISNPNMKSIPYMKASLDGKFFLGQSMDNTIVCYDQVKQNKQKKIFKNQNFINSGYAIRFDFSPDGQYLASGDARGNLWVWDWKTTRMRSKLNAGAGTPGGGHHQVIMSTVWHPFIPSMLITGSWDGTIKFWD